MCIFVICEPYQIEVSVFKIDICMTTFLVIHGENIVTN